jgi:hypothetical protein
MQNFNPSSITPATALRYMQAEDATLQGKTLTNLTDGEYKRVIDQQAELQARFAGDKTRVTGLAKLDLPLGEKSQQWLNEKGELADPNISQNEAVKQGYRPYKDAVKRLDQEGSSRLFMQHIQFLRDKGTPLFPEATGNMVKDAAVGQASALVRRTVGQSHPAVAALQAIDTPAALQMIKAVAPDARSGARLVQMFEGITDPYRPWTQKSYKEALDALQQMAEAGIVQRGRPGAKLPGQTIEPARGSATPTEGLDRDRTPTQTLERTDPRYRRLRTEGMSEDEIMRRFGVKIPPAPASTQ